MRCILLAAFLSVLTLTAQAVDVSVVGLFPGKAVLVVNQGRPKAYSVGAKVAQGVRLAAVNDSGAVLEINGKREHIAMGQHVGVSRKSGNGSVTLHADSRGHFVTHGQINGVTVRMLVDTGATMISMPAHDARRVGIDFKKGRVGHVRTANGVAMAYRIKLDKVKLGDIVLYQVDALVLEHGLHMTLLGMSFLNRTKMSRDGDTMMLEKRY